MLFFLCNICDHQKILIKLTLMETKGKMSKIVILGAGISGHVAASHLRRKLSKDHEVVVVSPNSNYQWIPSNIWVGIGRMKSEKILFPLAPLYKKKGIGYKQAKAVTFHPEGD